MRWFVSAWSGDFVTAIEVCVAASLDLRLHQSTRDLFVGIAVLDHFSLTDACADTHELIPRALEVADRSDVALHRATCLLGAAWGVAGADPDRALHLVRRAINEVPNVPALTRLTLPGSAARLLSRLDPSVAARGLLEQLDATPSRRSFIDLIPLFYAATLLDSLGDGSAGEALISVTSAPTAPQQSMMDFVDLARRAAMTSNLRSVGELEVTVRAALRDRRRRRRAGSGRLMSAADVLVAEPSILGTRSPTASFLDRLDTGQRDELLSLGHVRRYPAQSIIFFEGDAANDVVLIRAGDLKISATVEDREVVLDVLGPGDILGEVAAIDGLPRSATLTTLTASSRRSTSSSWRWPILRTPGPTPPLRRSSRPSTWRRAEFPGDEREPAEVHGHGSMNESIVEQAPPRSITFVRWVGSAAQEGFEQGE